MNFDDILVHLGDFGRYQKFLYSLICFAAVFNGIFSVISAILLEVPDHRCRIPWYVNDTYAIQNDLHLDLINNYIPPSSDDTLEYDQCHIYVFNRSSVTFDNSSHPINGTLVKCDEWVYSYDDFIETFTSKHNLVCDDSYKKSLAQSLYFVGIFFGAPLFGNLSDALGRKTSFYLATILLLVAGFGQAWSPNYAFFAVFMALVGAAAEGTYSPAFVIAIFSLYPVRHFIQKLGLIRWSKCRRTSCKAGNPENLHVLTISVEYKCGLELVGPAKRLYTGIIVNYFFAMGLVVLSGLAYLVREWSYLETVCAAPVVLLLSYWWLLPESPRWLVSKNRHQEAEVILRRAAKYNKVTIDDAIFSDFNKEDDQEVTEGRVWQLFTSRVLLLRSLVIFFNWCVITMVYYGLSLNSGNLGGNYYLNFCLSGLVEFPGYTLPLLLLDRVGRKKLYCSCMMLAGIGCLSTIFPILYLDEKYQPVTITLAMIGKLGIAAAFGIIFLYAAELFPTVVRNAGMGTSSMVARIGSVASPYIAASGDHIGGRLGKAFPLMIFGVAAIMAGILSLHLPETLNTELPETIEDGIKFGTPSYKSRKGIPLDAIGSTKTSAETTTDKSTHIASERL